MICKKCKKEIDDNSIFCMLCGHKQTSRVKSNKVRGNGQGSVYKLPNGTWRAAVTLYYTPIETIDGTLPKKRRIYKTKSGFKTKKEAIDYLHTLQNEKALKKEIKLFEIYDIWSPSHYANISNSAQSTYKTAYKKIAALHHRYISDIRLAEMQAIIDNTQGGYYPKKDIKVLLNQLFRYALIEDYIEKNYAEYIKLPPLEKPKKDAFTLDERNKLWNDYNAGNDFTGYILIMIYTGMRYGEISTILKKNIFLDNKYMIGGIKSEAGKNREIIIRDDILPIVIKFYNKCEKLLLEISEKEFYEQFKLTLIRSGVRSLDPHCCRHTLATMMAEDGVPPAIIKAVCGHKSYSTTIGYTHIKLDEKLKAMNKLKK